MKAIFLHLNMHKLIKKLNNRKQRSSVDRETIKWNIQDMGQ